MNKEHFRKLAKEDPYKIPGWVFIGETPMNHGLTKFEGKAIAGYKGMGVTLAKKEVSRSQICFLYGSDGPQTGYFISKENWDNLIGEAPIAKTEKEIAAEIAKKLIEIEELKKQQASLASQKEKRKKIIIQDITTVAIKIQNNSGVRTGNSEYHKVGIYLFGDSEIEKFGTPILVQDREGAWVIVFEKHKKMLDNGEI